MIFFKCYFTNVKSIHILLLWAKFHLKSPLGKRFFEIWPQSKWREIKIGYFAAILKQYKILEFFFAELWFFIASTYMVQTSLQNSVWKVVFSGGSMEPLPLGHQRELKYLGHLSVNI